VVTNRRAYVLDYSVSAGTPDTQVDDLIYSLRFTYPAVVPSGPSNAQRVAQDLAQPDEHTFRNIDYWYCGEPGLQPVAASDDGVHTRLRFGPSAEIPAIFVRSDDGVESLLNYSVDAGDIIVHRTARRLILRRGKLVGCILNKGYSGAGQRLDTGTVSPHVRRETTGVQP
jgi:type IV secretion system protein VirB9